MIALAVLVVLAAVLAVPTLIALAVLVVLAAVLVVPGTLCALALTVEAIEETLLAGARLVAATVAEEIVAADALADGRAVLEGPRIEAALLAVVVARERVTLLLYVSSKQTAAC